MSLISDLRPRLGIPSLGDTTLGPGFADVDVGTAVVTGASRLGGQLVAHLLDLAIQTLILLPDDGYVMGMVTVIGERSKKEVSENWGIL